jgi:hypothetical protein
MMILVFMHLMFGESNLGILIFATPLFEFRTAPLVLQVFHVIIPTKVVIGNQFTLLNVTGGNGKMIELRTDTIGDRIPFSPQNLCPGVDLCQAGIVGLVVTGVIGKGMERQYTRVNHLSEAAHATVKAIPIYKLTQLVEFRALVADRVPETVKVRGGNLQANGTSMKDRQWVSAGVCQCSNDPV